MWTFTELQAICTTTTEFISSGNLEPVVTEITLYNGQIQRNPNETLAFQEVGLFAFLPTVKMRKPMPTYIQLIIWLN